MKKLLSFLLAVVIIFACCACSNFTITEGLKGSAPFKIEYYPDSSVPTLDSVLDEPQIDSTTEYPLYGPYDTEEEGKAIMQLYIATLIEEYGFSRIDTSVGYEVTNGSDTVKVVGGNYKDKLAIAVFVNL